jgi:DNA-binding GntR family transcriptional regulator
MSDVLGDRSTSTVVVDALRQEIIRGELPPGARLRQDAIASRFGVSQTVAREAFKDLVRESLLVAEPRRGVSVALMSALEAEEMTRLRTLVESQALAWAIPNMMRTDFDCASSLIEKLDRAESVDELIAQNALFHRALYQPCNRVRTLMLIETLRQGFERYLRYTWESTSHLRQSQEEHRKLVNLCQQRDIEGACALLRQHIATTGVVLVDSLKHSKIASAAASDQHGLQGGTVKQTELPVKPTA